MKKVFIVLSNDQYDTMYLRNGFDVVANIEEADFIQFTGGEDVSPRLYGQNPHPSTHSSEARDMFEMRVYDAAIDRGVPMVGICRGGQFLNVMSGGIMKQHVDGHAIGGEHLMVDLASGEMVSVTSTHHQMMSPDPDLGELIAVASESTYWEDGERTRHKSERGDDCEVVWYPKTKALCFQPHPEYVAKSHQCQMYFFELLNQYVTGA
ncbi:MAG TPA: gamma-glutamyl-gamma-aminobutyrate hydrolase family protein [Candidatus Obscuribacterales bacterium]